MPNISEAEARLLLSRPLRREGDRAWTRRRNRQEDHLFSSGLLDECGTATSMFVELAYVQGAKGRKKYAFSVFRFDRDGRERVYQLEVLQGSRLRKDVHGRSHEHIGDLRLPGHTHWQHWSYHEVLTYFCAQTNILFDPFPPSPE